MTILEPIINDVSEQFGLRGKAGPTMNALLIVMSNERTGGLQGFLDQFRRAGLGETVSSWVLGLPSASHSTKVMTPVSQAPSSWWLLTTNPSSGDRSGRWRA